MVGLAYSHRSLPVQLIIRQANLPSVQPGPAPMEGQPDRNTGGTGSADCDRLRSQASRAEPPQDHKARQRDHRKVMKMNSLRQQQYETGDALVEHDPAAAALAAAKAQPVDAEKLAKFKSLAIDLNTVLDKWRKAGKPYSTVSVDEASIDRAGTS